VDKGFHTLDESVIDSNPFCVRVVRVFRCSICVFQDYFREMGSTRASRVVFGALAEHRGCSSDAVAEVVRVPVGGAPTGAAEAAALPRFSRLVPPTQPR